MGSEAAGRIEFGTFLKYGKHILIFGCGRRPKEGSSRHKKDGWVRTQAEVGLRSVQEFIQVKTAKFKS